MAKTPGAKRRIPATQDKPAPAPPALSDVRAKIDEIDRTIQSLIAEFELTPQDVFPPARSRSTVAGTKVAPKYRDPATGQTWTGRGKPPKWIQGQDRAKFAI